MEGLSLGQVSLCFPESRPCKRWPRWGDLWRWSRETGRCIVGDTGAMRQTEGLGSTQNWRMDASNQMQDFHGFSGFQSWSPPWIRWLCDRLTSKWSTFCWASTHIRSDRSERTIFTTGFFIRLWQPSLVVSNRLEKVGISFGVRGFFFSVAKHGNTTRDTNYASHGGERERERDIGWKE